MSRKSDDAKKAKVSWTASEDDALLKAVLDDQNNREPDADEEEDWDEIAKNVQEKTPVQCLKRYLSLSRKQASTTAIAAQASEPNLATNKEDTDENDEVDEEDEDDDDEDDSEGPPAKKQKRSKREAEASAKWTSETSGKWTPEEMELLKKLVEQYKDCKCRELLVLNFEFWSEILQYM